MSAQDLPVGQPEEEGSSHAFPRCGEYDGQFIRLAPVDSESDVQHLFECSHGTAEKESLWTYMGYGPFGSLGVMKIWLAEKSVTTEPTFLTVHKRDVKRPVGMVSFLNIIPDMRRVELGHIWYGPEAQRTRVNTEAIYLMLCEAFDRLRYRRVEWKCDSLNARSRSAALRLGFRFEGIFRNHMIVKERSRDTAWFSIIDSEWERIKKNMETWLYGSGNHSLGELNARSGDQDS